VKTNLKKVNFLASSMIVLLLILLGKLLSFGKDVVISGFFGMSTDTDAYFIALNITGIIFGALYATISMIFLPLYNEAKNKLGVVACSKFVSSVLNLYTLVAVLLTILCVYFAEQIVGLVIWSSDQNYLDFTTLLLKVMVVSFVFTTIVAFMTAIQQSHHKYLYLHMSPVLNNLCIVVAVVAFSSVYGIVVAAFAGVVSWLALAIWHVYLTKGYFQYQYGIEFNSIEMKKLGVLFLPAFLGVFVDQANIMVDTVLASDVGEGGVSALNYASRLISFSGGMFIMAVMTIMYPMFAKSAALEDKQELCRAIRQSLRVVSMLMLFVTAIVIVYYREIVVIVFQRGAFGVDDAEITASVFFMYGIGLMFIGLREVFNKAFYAQQDTKTPLLIGIVTVLVNICLSISLVGSFGVEGLALATSASLFLCVILQVIYLARMLTWDLYSGIGLFFGQLIVSLMLMFFVLHGWQAWFVHEDIYFRFLFGSTLGVVTFMVCMYVLGNKEVQTFVKQVSAKFVRTNN